MKQGRAVIFCICLIVLGALLLSQKIHIEPTAEIFLDKSSKYVGADRPHDLGYTGKGVRIAVIDTGVDYSHPDLFGFGKGAKVVGGYDFVERDDTPSDTNGHGTEVAGIIAANGNIIGIAPDAEIFAYRVSDTGNSVSSDLIVSAIRQATEDGVDIINISLGVNRTNHRIDEAINDAVEKGIVVVVAAGNSGPDKSTIGSPGRNPHAITVGATYNNITASLVATLQVGSEQFQVLPMVGMPQISQSIEAQIVFAKYARVDDLKDMDAKDKILLVERGSDREGELVYFSEKEKNSAASGARAVIVFNSEPGIFLGDLRNQHEGPEYTPQIPIVSMSREDGLFLRSLLQNKTSGTINTFYHPDFVSFFSSRGPVSPFYIKPDLVAPGVFVNATSLNGGYNLTSGTSFAAPHVSGAIALLLQKNPSLTPQQVSSIITTTADPISDTFGTRFPYEISGAGRLNATRAFEANTVIVPPYAVFDLSPFSKSKTASFSLESLDGSRHDVRVGFDFDNVVEFDYDIKADTISVNASLIDDAVGVMQGSILVSDGNASYRIPTIVRVTEASVDITEEGGVLDFAVISTGEWSYAKISVFNSDAMLVGSSSITPTRSGPIPIYEPGLYWVEADLKTANKTISVSGTIQIDVPVPRPVLDLGATGIPEDTAIIIGIVAAAMILVGAIIRRA